MDTSKLTMRSQEALQAAQSMAQQQQHQVLESAHVFLGILEVDQDVIPALLEKQGVHKNGIQAAARAMVDNFPKVQGGEMRASNALAHVLRNALNDLPAWKDQFLAVDALFYHVCQSKDALRNIFRLNACLLNHCFTKLTHCNRRNIRLLQPFQNILRRRLMVNRNPRSNRNSVQCRIIEHPNIV